MITKTLESWCGSNKVHSVIILSSLLVALILPRPAVAWAHKIQLNQDYWFQFMTKTYTAGDRKNLLLFKVLEAKNIYFCTSSENPKTISEDSLAIQATVALKVWLKAFSEAGIASPKITRTRCDDTKLNLRVREIIKVTDQKSFGATAYETESEGSYSSISLVKGKPEDRGGRELLDFQSFLPSDVNFEKALIRVLLKSVTIPSEVPAELKGNGVDIYWSTYPTLLHEMGHAFGLDDTYGRLDLLDKVFKSGGEQPSSVMMADKTYLNLTADDFNGIKSLVLRFYGKIPKFETAPSLNQTP